MTGWPLEIGGDVYRPIPDSWIEHGDDHGQGDPRLYAVAVAYRLRGQLVVRYHNPRAEEVLHVTMGAADSPSSDGLVPALLVRGSWPRSIVPTPDVEPTDVPREPERQHLRVLWGDRVVAVPAEDRIVADGGEYWIIVTAHGATDRDLHTDEDYPNLQMASGYKPTQRAKHPNKGLCSVCSGDFDRYDGGSSGPHELLDRLDAADVGGDGRAV